MVSRWKKSTANRPWIWLRRRFATGCPRCGEPVPGGRGPGSGGSCRLPRGVPVGRVHPGFGGAPIGNFLCQAHNQVADLLGDGRTPHPVWVGPLLSDQTRCQASSVAGATMRHARSGRGSSLARTDRIARSDPVGRGLPTWRRSTAISCRSASTSAINTDLLPESNANQLSSRTMSKYRRRNATGGDHPGLRC
jgi:hypothetical protein